MFFIFPRLKIGPLFNVVKFQGNHVAPFFDQMYSNVHLRSILSPVYFQ